MATRERTRDRAHELADRLLATAGSEIRMSRRAAGLSLRACGADVGLDYATLSRLERHGLEHVTVRQLALACAAVGLDLSIRAFPAGDAVRDAGHLRLLARFRARLPAGLELATEVPLPIPGDRRALDGWLRLLDGTMGVEAETRLADLQAAERKALQKQRDPTWIGWSCSSPIRAGIGRRWSVTARTFEDRSPSTRAPSWSRWALGDCRRPTGSSFSDPDVCSGVPASALDRVLAIPRPSAATERRRTVPRPPAIWARPLP